MRTYSPDQAGQEQLAAVLALEQRAKGVRNLEPALVIDAGGRVAPKHGRNLLHFSPQISTEIVGDDSVMSTAKSNRSVSYAKFSPFNRHGSTPNLSSAQMVPDTARDTGWRAAPRCYDRPVVLPETLNTAQTSVVMPAFNEAASIGRVVRDLAAAAPWHEILVVDDGSSDETGARAADRRRARHPPSLQQGQRRRGEDRHPAGRPASSS